MRRVSGKRSGENREYAKLRLAFLIEHPVCQACEEAASSQVHHTRGRIGRLLCMVRFWMAVCRGCHQWITEHPVEARERGWTCAAKEWNVVP